MKIMHVCLVGAYNEGWNYQENMLSKFHAQQGNDVMLICIPYEQFECGIRIAKDTNYTNEYGVKVRRLQIRRSIAGKLVWYKGVKETLHEFMPEVIFVHGCQFMDAKQIFRYGKRFPKTKIYVDNHADFKNSAKNWASKMFLHKIVWRHMAQILNQVAVKYYGVLPARVDFLKNVYRIPAEKCELLVMGADDDTVEKTKLSNSRNRIRSQYGISDNDFLIVSGGKINSNRPETISLMKAVNLLDCSRVKMLVFGSVAEDLKKEFEENCVDKKIIFAGWIDSKLTYDYMAAADLIVFPGLHSVMWEQAVGMGVPCVFRKIDGFNHVDLGGNAVFLDDVSIEGLQNVLKTIVMDTKKYNTMKRIAEEKGMKVFSYKDIAYRCING